MLRYCKIPELYNFKLNSTLNYKIKEIDLYGTCSKDSKRNIDKQKLCSFVNKLSRTKLTRALDFVHVKSDLFPETEVQFMFDFNGFDTVIIGDTKAPKYERALKKKEAFI